MFVHDVCWPSAGAGRVNKGSNLYIHDANIADKIENQDGKKLKEKDMLINIAGGISFMLKHFKLYIL